MWKIAWTVPFIVLWIMKKYQEENCMWKIAWTVPFIVLWIMKKYQEENKREK